MEQKIKFIVIGLMVILAISLFMNLQIQTAKKNLELERDELKSENASLSKKIDEASRDIQELKRKADSINNDLIRVTQEKEEIQKQKDQVQKDFGLIMKERDILIEKLKTQAQVKEEPKEVTPKTDDAYWAGVLKAKTDLALQLENLRGELKTAKINNEQLERDLNNLSRANQELANQVNYNQKMLDSLTAELVIERNTSRQQQENLKSIKNENVILRRQLNSLSSRKADLEKRVFKLQEEKNETEKQFNQMAAVLENKLGGISDLRQQLNSLDTTHKTKAPQKMQAQIKESVELPAIIVRPQSEDKKQTSQETYKAKIISLNKENNFVVIDLGQDAGIKLGDTFKVYRNNKEIANLEVIQTRKNISACDIRQENAPLRVGDVVK